MKAWSRKIILSTLAASALLGWLTPAEAAIERVTPLKMRSLILTCSTFDFSKGFDIAAIKPIESSRTFKQEDISKIIPRTLTPTSDGSVVAAQIVDHSLSNLFNSDYVKNSDFGRTAHMVEQKMSADIAFGGEQPDSVKHTVKFAMQAAQAKAKLEYSGLTNAELVYHVAQATMNLEVRERLQSMDTDLVFNHVNSQTDTRDMVSLRWAW